MEIGRVAEIDNAKQNNIEKSQKVNNLEAKQKVIQDDEYKKNQGQQYVLDKNEVILDNIKFGYNRNSKDFFVKVTRGEAEYKYPTEDMMKVKAFVLQEMEQKINKQ
ncbi:flagellin [Arcobacter aquimarinus]|uniref:FlaG family protein n=1 Tax=Arcobacter aquimarinus TaxID=1315211 RepID=A0AAE7E242_9BACT|nr:flagellin [Arcobacter aquimarinus]QKE26814.1 FlaG family protein [Arcobacter aquimarinus]RXI32185.1 flagellin [Arcobacter aquimarinus]